MDVLDRQRVAIKRGHVVDYRGWTAHHGYPMDLRSGGWFYESAEGLVVVTRKEGVGATATISWEKVSRAIAHHRKIIREQTRWKLRRFL
jgi:hypothetical protein